ncbi:MAG: molybdopterin-dependent oxidoreductase [Lachnospiraceae bacterium]|jgi:anaerobic selenocysteine-containing dehydrogenase|nr:molybdopterin-dependent oxidoreductase [Lachnospiraceae bacterium]MCI8958263.1 molybdopterin-dependent oxidoreductase [Lachnospiraceae bacterium]
MSGTSIVKTLCRMCDDHCGIDCHVEEGKVVKIEGNQEHVWNRGRLCIKGSHGTDMIYAPDRIRKPLKKTENGFVEIPLKQALDEIAEKIRNIQTEYGPQAVGVWKGEAVGFAQEEELARRWIHAIGSPNYFSNDSACFAGRWIGYSLVYGRWNAQPDFENSRCIIIWGANPPHAHPNMTQQINRAREKGASLIVIDPRFSAIARQADLYVKVKPGSDGALAWGLMRELIERGWTDQEFIQNFTVGFGQVKEYARKFTYEYVARETGCDAASVIPELARKIKASMPHTVIYVGNGLEHHENGINNIRACAYLDGLIGAVDQKGANYSPVGFPMKELVLYKEKPLLDLGPIGRDRFPILYHYRQECHTMTLMDQILSGKPYPFKALVLTGANPAMTNPNSFKVRKALGALDLLVVHELFMSETAELADYILPAASYLERSEMHVHGGTQTVTLTRRVLTPQPEVTDEYTMFHELAVRLGAGDYFPWKDEDELNAWLVSDSGISIETLKAHPSGYHYAPVEYEKHKRKKAAGEKPFNTASGMFEFTSAILKEHGYQELAEYISPRSNEVRPDRPYTLVTGARKVMYYHGRNHNLPALASALPEAEIEMHPADAARIGVESGSMVKVTSDIGSVVVPVKVMEGDEIGEGVLQMTHGWKSHNVNQITHDNVFDPISGFPLMKAVQVSVEPY